MSAQEHIAQERAEKEAAAAEARRAAALAASGDRLTRAPMLDGEALKLARAAQDLALEAQAALDPEDGRPRGARRPFGQQEQTLQWPRIPGFRLYWFNEVPGRIGRAKEAGYDHVRDEDGSPVTRITGKSDSGGGLQSFLMKIPEDWYRDDVRAANRAESDKLDDIKRGRFMAPEGSNQYVPQQGIRVERR